LHLPSEEGAGFRSFKSVSSKNRQFFFKNRPFLLNIFDIQQKKRGLYQNPALLFFSFLKKAL
jgi:hypothetical protein